MHIVYCIMYNVYCIMYISALPCITKTIALLSHKAVSVLLEKPLVLPLYRVITYQINYRIYIYICIIH